MRSIAIIGGGHAGLQLGIGLLQHGYKVCVVTDRDADAIKNGRILSSQGMQKTGLDHERALGLNFWEEEAPKIEFFEFSRRTDDGGRDVNWRAIRPAYGNSICQRVKIPRWMEEFERLGGVLQIHQAGVADIDALAQRHDLVIVASGKGEVGRLFERDALRSIHDKPQRALALTYVTGMEPTTPVRGNCFSMAPGIGEYFVMPALTTSGPCEIMVFEGIVGGPMDSWSDVGSPQEHLARSKELLQRFFPWEAARCAKIELTDANGTLTGRFPPTVRKPVATMPSGRAVLGIGDVVMLNDPLTGQGSNNASKAAWHYLQRILAHGDQAFDRGWMQETFESFWRERGCLTTEWSNRMLDFTPHMHDVVEAANDHHEVAQRFAASFNHAPDYFPWLFDREVADRMFGPIFGQRHRMKEDAARTAA
ncbi:styrene monooxygenase/indole monooxygenase family protein [Pusillimonas noertemannii]|uniref:2-polyprenyl-6-methoxyphenol hydroxylase-like FAD-dependent oxidoreductase n=1 Tax=Pusillimonas noertemannii TaxID=305977 RepID=A0A2U1CL22_9BURK|nr:styrene monooxygenase/indole monooxygenase family protein [Pusillimonas noertemannii]NYT69223.1 FAD-dependent oxidoreductase [Pusillimonas noertemannii]PVY61692.1 2-polyprenyl-6-methoxyphenol hydroxylase-like FAD-dependent oxidoreductase [Pusillimonas noertemannii]TFL09632.1 FAD-binding oxidoreductase [Pusillimonas noertemannii]